MSGLGEGQPHAMRSIPETTYLKTGNPGMNGGGTYTGTSTQPTMEQWENIFGPAGRDIKTDQQRHKRHQRWHLPDALKGHNQYLTDRIDGLITDKTESPFTRNILPYVYLENPDQKLKWNVYSFDEGIASRVPYEAAARVLPQSKKSFAGYTIRQGLAIAMEHNFMVSAAGRENFRNQLTQLVGSIQLTNDLDVHVALLQAPSYQRHMNEKYHDNNKSSAQICREFVDLFGIMQKVPNALDWLIEDAKNHLKTWGSQAPTFLLCNGGLTTQLTMIPEKTNYITNGPDGQKRLAAGPDLPSYRGLSIINSRKFSMDAGTAPRDLLRRRVRVAEYYRIPYHENNHQRMYEFYDQSRDTMFRLSYEDLVNMSKLNNDDTDPSQNHYSNDFWQLQGDSQDYDTHDFNSSNKRVPYLPRGGKMSWNGKSMVGVSAVNSLAFDISTDVKIESNALEAQGGLTWTPAMLDEKITQDFAVGSETFGGGIHNDVFAYSNKTVKLEADMDLITNYNGLCSTKVAMDNNFMLFVWWICKLCKDLNDSDAIGSWNKSVTSIESDIASGAGYPMMPDCWNWKKGTLSFETLTLCMMIYSDIEKATIKSLSDPSALLDAYKKHLGGYESSKAGVLQKQMEKFKTDVAKDDGTALNHLKAFIHFSLRDQPSSLPTSMLQVQHSSEIQKQIATMISNSLTGMTGLDSLVSSTLTSSDTNVNPLIDFLTKIAHDIHHRYKQFMTMWAACVYVERHGNTSTNTHFQKANDLKDVFLSDFVYQEMYNNVKGKHGAAGLNGIIKYVAKHKNQLYVNNMTLQDAFLYEMRNSTPAAVMSSNVQQALTAMQCFGRPNLHCNFVSPLVWDDMQNSATSVDSNVWFVQALAGMSPLSFDACESLMKHVNKPMKCNDICEFLCGDKHMNDDENGKSFLMSLWLSMEHPDKNSRDAAQKETRVSTAAKKELCKAVAESIRQNKKTSTAFSEAIKKLLPVNLAVDTNHCNLFCPCVASDRQVFFSAYSNTFYGDDAPVSQIPVCVEQKFTTVYDTQTRQNGLNGPSEKPHSNPPPVSFVYDPVSESGNNHKTKSDQKSCAKLWPWLQRLEDSNFESGSALNSYRFPLNVKTHNQQNVAPELYDDADENLRAMAMHAADFCEYNYEVAFRHIIMVLAQRFFTNTSRFFNNGRGMPHCMTVKNTVNTMYSNTSFAVSTTKNLPKGAETQSKSIVMRVGHHFMHGPVLNDLSGKSSSNAVGDIIILRPNIEHEMLGIIMGRGGTQELGATFWGQTELSCYDDAQHGIWGMSYKYHERAMVTNERNLIRVFDVAFDGYNGGMDQRVVDWNDNASVSEFRNATYARETPYNGPSMLVMMLPKHHKTTKTAWPNPIIFQQNVSGNITPDPQKDTPLYGMDEARVFDHVACPALCTPEIAQKYQQYMTRLEMHQWASIDQNSRTAGDSCISNETCSSLLAFQGSMRVLNSNGAEIECTMGSGHLGPSFVGVASIREGRGMQNPVGMPAMVRQV